MTHWSEPLEWCTGDKFKRTPQHSLKCVRRYVRTTRDSTLAKTHRGTIFVEEGEILEQQSFEGDQYVLKIHSPKLAAAANPGDFAHLQCDPTLPQRRPMSVMLTDPEAGWVQFLYKDVGKGTHMLAARQPGHKLSVLGPIGKGFALDPTRNRPLLLGGGVGIPPMVFVASRLRSQLGEVSPLVMMGSEVPFPFRVSPSQILVPSMPEGVIAAMPLMEDWGIASRLASGQGYAGCFDGFITELARSWLASLSAEHLSQVYILACGPTPMLQATAKLAAEFNVPSQLSLEEYMACAVGGCAGCTVAIEEQGEIAMRRVCVDGPVFDGATIRWQ